MKDFQQCTRILIPSFYKNTKKIGLLVHGAGRIYFFMLAGSVVLFSLHVHCEFCSSPREYKENNLESIQHGGKMDCFWCTTEQQERPNTDQASGAQSRPAHITSTSAFQYLISADMQIDHHIKTP